MQNALAITSFVLALIALIPFVLETIFYFRKPQYKIDVSWKSLARSHFDFMISVQPSKPVIVSKICISSELPYKLAAHPRSTGNFSYSLKSYQKNRAFSPSLIIEQNNQPLDAQSGKGYNIRLKEINLRNTIDFTHFRLEIVIDSEVDYYRLGWLSIFYKTRGYRHVKEIKIRSQENTQHFTIK